MHGVSDKLVFPLWFFFQATKERQIVSTKVVYFFSVPPLIQTLSQVLPLRDTQPTTTAPTHHRPLPGSTQFLPIVAVRCRFSLRPDFLFQYSATVPSPLGYSANVVYSETSFGGEKVKNVGAFATYTRGRYRQLSVTYSAQFRNYERFGGDWRREFGRRGGYVRFGLDSVRRNTGWAAGLAEGGPDVLPLAGSNCPCRTASRFA
jgi:hypothetical protein